jgi:hypothetical protein
MIPGPGLLLAGVAAAALMGVGLGLWARPAMNERRMSIAAFEAPMSGPARMLQIVVGEVPAPGAPIEVLPASRAAPARPTPEHVAPEPLAPVRPPAGLVRVQAVEPEPEPEPVEVAPPPKPKPKPQVHAQAQAPAAPVKPVKVKATPPPKAAPKPVQLVKVKQVEKAKRVDKPHPAKPTLAKTVEKPAASKVRLIKAEAPQRPLHIQKTIAKKPAKSASPVHAAAHTPPRKVEPAPKVQKVTLERKVAKPATPVKAVKQAKPVKQLKPVPAAKRSAEKVAIKAKPPEKAAPTKAIRPARGAGPLRVAKAAPRPDPTISDADRQMNRAYSSARAAGVPDWQLRRQQQRWEQARAAAAREAPWAVHDVYLARIAELHDLTRDAEGPQN